MDHFRHFFRVKTGLEWQDRVLRQGTQPATCFQYSPPVSFTKTIQTFQMIEIRVLIIGIVLQLGGKSVGGDLRFSYDYCVRINEELRGQMPTTEEKQDGGDYTADATENTQLGDCSSREANKSQDHADSGYGSPSEETPQPSAKNAIGTDIEHT